MIKQNQILIKPNKDSLNAEKHELSHKIVVEHVKSGSIAELRSDLSMAQVGRALAKLGR